MDSNFMRKLNEAQRKAVTCESKAVQILAGPGSGKTRVLTSRVAWLVLSKNENPSRIVVVTFTKKAANEMRQRLQSTELLGPASSDRLAMGTFHSLCATMLRRNGSLVDLKKNFTIADTDVSLHVLKKLKKELSGDMSKYGNEMKPEAFLNVFSKARNKGMNVDEYIAKNQQKPGMQDLCLMFRAYEDRLKAENMVDFDNLLLFTRKLVLRFPHVANFVSHVLVDEFQDTNSVQYDIIKGLTHNGHKALTIVGDPDQSIYGWRNADRENFIKMQSEFDNTEVCNLEENYRSTKSILTAAFHVVNQDQNRIQKSLFTQNADGVPISMLKMSSDTMEAQSVAEEIKRIIEYSGGLITYKDIAVLSRMNYLSRAFEQAFNAAGIPYIVVGGVKFFERAEVKDIIAYLRFFYNTNDTEAFERIINKPRRGVGEVTMNKIEEQSRKKNWNIIRVLESIGQGTAKNITVPAKAKRNLHEFVGLYEHIRAMIENRDSISTMLEHIIEAIDYRTFLTKEHPDKDGESRWENVGELVSYAKMQFDPQRRPETEQPEDDNNEGLGDNDIVARFLESTTLIGTGKEEEEAELGKVTISTMHSAKGLEWPVVFTVACEAGIMPHPKAEDEMEESRLLYVGMTRAKCFLYCTHAASRVSWGSARQASLSHYLTDMPTDTYTKQTPRWDTATRAWVAEVLEMPYPENCTSEHKGDEIWMEEEREWDNFGDDDYGGYGRGYGYGSYGSQSYRRSNYKKPSTSKSSISKSSASKPSTSKPSTSSAPKPRGTAQSVQSLPYSSFGSAAFVLEEQRASSKLKTTKKTTGIKRANDYGFGTSYARKK